MRFNFTDFKMSGGKILDRLIELVYLAVIFLIPLWFSYWFPTYNIFEFNKIVLFKILIWLLLFFTLIKVIFYAPRSNFPVRQFFRKYWLVPTIFIIGLSLTLVSSLNPIQSFYGTIERQAGVSSYLFYFLWFILVSFNILVGLEEKASADNKLIAKKIKRIVIIAVSAGFLVALYGILQILNIDFLNWPEKPYLTHRALSSFGQPNFLASWLLLVIPLGVYLFSTSRRLLAKFAWLLITIIQLLCLFFTGSRGGLVALFFVAFLYLFYLLVSSSWSRQKKIFISLLFMISVVFSLCFLDYFSGGRLRELKNHDYGSLGARSSFYQAAAEAIIIRPIFGYGLENSKEVFIKYYNSDWGVYGEVGQSPDRAHNLFLDILLTTGAVGLLLFLVLYYFFFDLVRLNSHQKKKPNLNLALSLGAAAYLSSLFFSFTIVTGEIYFWLFLALLVVINVSEKIDWRTEILNVRGRTTRLKLWFVFKIMATIALAIIIFWQIVRVFETLIADYYFNQIYIALANHDYRAALTSVDYLSAQKTNPINKWTYDFFLGEKLVEVYPSLIEPGIKIAIAEKLKKLENSLPDQGYQYLLVKAEINGILGNFSVGRAYLSQVIALTPHWPLVYLNAGQLALAAGNYKEALLAYHLAAFNLPDVDDSRLNEEHHQGVLAYQYFIASKIGDIYQRQKNYTAAEKYYHLAYRNNPADFTLLKKISDTYYQRGDLEGAVRYSLHGLARNPNDYNWSLILAILYQEMGDRSQVLNYIKQGLKLAPENYDLKILEQEYRK